MAEAPSSCWHDFANRDALVSALVERLATDFRNAHIARAAVLFGASGGSTPKPVYAALATMDLPWSALQVLVVDERFVALDSDHSNQRMIAGSLLAGHPEAGLIGLWSDVDTLDAGAATAAARVRDLNAAMDVVLLGMGEDGHFASCFPTATEFAASIDPDGAALVLPISPMPAGVQPAIERLTLTWSYIRRSGRIVLAITGARKRAVLLQAMQAEDPAQLPVATLFKPGMPAVEIYWSP